MDFEYQVDGALYAVTLQKNGQKFIIKVNDNSFEADVLRVSPHVLSVLVAGRSYRIFSAGSSQKLLVS